jgi:hypothetical protein
VIRNRYELEVRYNQDDLNEEKIHELHEIVKPYILRRIKADVLKLPPKVRLANAQGEQPPADNQIEIIVPISLSSMQKEIYRGIYEKNADLLRAIVESRKKKTKKAEFAALGKAPAKGEAEADTGAAAVEGGIEVDKAAPLPTPLPALNAAAADKVAATITKESEQGGTAVEAV